MTERHTNDGHRGAVVAQAGGFDVVECEACRFRHLVPIPTPAELAQAARRALEEV